LLALPTGSTDADDIGMAKLGWAVKRLSDGPGPTSGLAAFLGRHEKAIEGEGPLTGR